MDQPFAPTALDRPRLLRLAELAGILLALAAGVMGALAGLGLAPFAAHAASHTRNDRAGSVDASSSAGAGSSNARTRGTTTFVGDWQTGDNSQWSGLECPNPERQFRVVAAPARPGMFASRYEVQPSDVWAGNDTVRCLDARYDTGEGNGEEHWFGLSLYLPSPGVGDALLWELHHPASLYQLPGCGVAPFALLADHGALVLRIAGGDCVIGTGWKIWNPAVPIHGFAPYPRDTWIDVVAHIRFSEQPNGLVELWARRSGTRWPARPLIRRTGIPTLPYSSQANVHDVRLYTEVGLYKGGAAIDSTEVAYLTGYRRGTSFAAATADDRGPLGKARATGPGAGRPRISGRPPRPEAREALRLRQRQRPA